MQVGIIGGGIMGITLGYLLARRGVQVEIFEASPVLGGLAGPLHLPDGVAVDRFYHAILSSDASLMRLCQELGISDQLRFRETRTGFFHEGGLYSMNNLVEFLTFKPLGLIDRFRLGLTVLYAQLWNDWRKLEGEPVERWLIRASGRRTYEAIWGQMLKAKFDGAFADIPATWMWARLVRTKSTRKGVNQKEMSGHLIGGYATLLKAMAERIEAAGGVVHLRTPVQEIVLEQGRARGIRVNGEVRDYDAVAATVQVPLFQRLIPGADPAYRDFLGQTEYLGVVCPLLVLDRPLTGFWTLNITDLRVPFTGVIETTSYIDPQYVGGHYLVYVPKYTAPGSIWQSKTDEEIKAIWIENLKLMFPDFDEGRIRHFLVHRERYVEPLHRLNSTHQIPEIRTPVQRLYLATTAQIYPALTNGESVARHAQATVDQILADQPTQSPAPVSG